MTNKEQEKRILELEKEILVLKGIKKEKKAKAFSDVKSNYLNNLNIIKKNVLDDNRFDSWFDNQIKISKEIELFLQDLLKKYSKFLSSYNEDTLKVLFIGAILSKVDFINQELEIGSFFHAPLSYKNDKINFNGFCDFYVASGLDYPDKPFFFIQEYKPSAGGSHPEPQLVAELIAAVELNNWKTIKGVYIIGAIWNFVILEKLGKNKYQYFVSKTFNSTNIIDLKDIFRNLLFVKNEIVEYVKQEIKQNDK